ncbi:hypothetical protein ISO80_08345 [Morganella morganii subsp. morganii]|uniref:hypothetical protein n=1 Tax=Morganella morganii TaxID=582 RepID=UPI001BDB5BB2|nr:hypothetical protein [Morganella morganii]MBT0349160.1 hypothetical protein [Morganella morganii subsp. morganii]
MPDAIRIDTARYKADLASSLYSVTLDQASKECSTDLLHLISIACDLNQQISRSLHGEDEVSV